MRFGGGRMCVLVRVQWLKKVYTVVNHEKVIVHSFSHVVVYSM